MTTPTVTTWRRLYWSGVLAGFKYPNDSITHEVRCSIPAPPYAVTDNSASDAASLDRAVKLGQAAGRLVKPKYAVNPTWSTLFWTVLAVVNLQQNRPWFLALDVLFALFTVIYPAVKR